MHDNVSGLHRELYFEGSLLVIAQKRLACDGRVRLNTARRVRGKALSCVISLVVIMLLRASLCMNGVLIDDIHSGWAH